jgi:hypothetical protein
MTIFNFNETLDPLHWCSGVVPPEIFCYCRCMLYAKFNSYIRQDGSIAARKIECRYTVVVKKYFGL